MNNAIIIFFIIIDKTIGLRVSKEEEIDGLMFMSMDVQLMQILTLEFNIKDSAVVQSVCERQQKNLLLSKRNRNYL